MENSDKKTVMTDEERLKLAAKLDAELDVFIDGLEKKRYTEGWPEDRWEAEMEKHPFFMKKAPEDNEELSPLMEGLQQLKYSPEENTPEELADNYKQDGTFNYKHKKYRLAILSYTEGIRTRCANPDLMAQLYNNRAAAHYMLKNYRSSLTDCKKALKLKPNYPKVLHRAANNSFNIKEYNQCIQFCDNILKEQPTDYDILNLRAQAHTEKSISERNKRRQDKLEKNINKEVVRLFNAIKSRGINLELTEDNKYPELQDLEPKIPQIAENRVQLDTTDRLVWPVMFLYPETKQTDFIQSFHEDIPMIYQLEDMFKVPLEWDSEHRYKLDNINVYFENKDKSSIQIVDASLTLGKILQNKSFIVRGGTPAFFIFVRSSEAENHFLSSY